MLKIVIIDDEKHVRILIKKLLSLVGITHTIVGEAAFVEEGKEIIENTNPDIVLLDIKLKDGSGFDLLDKLDKIDFQLIFITAFNEYAVKAFKINALDYILKPIDLEELKKGIEKAQRQLDSKDTLNKLLQNFKENEKSNTQKLVIKTTQETFFIPINDIYYFQSDGSYTKVFSKKIDLIASKNLKYFQSILPKNQFIRTHQSFLINKLQVEHVKQQVIILKNNVEIPISTRKKTEIIQLLS